MLEPYRTAFNERFTMGKYAELLRQLKERTRAEVEFRVCETPCFFAPEMMQRLVQTGEELTAQLLDSERYMRDSEAAIPAQYRVPGVEGLYLAGPFMHPGGTVTLGGRATAMKMLMDWKIDLKKAFSVY